MRPNNKRSKPLTGMILLLIATLALSSCDNKIKITSGDLQIEFDSKMYSRLSSLDLTTAPFQEEFRSTDWLETKNFKTDEFKVIEAATYPLDDPMGVGYETLIKGIFRDGDVCMEKIISAKTYASFPNVVIFDVSYVNSGIQDIRVHGWYRRWK